MDTATSRLSDPRYLSRKVSDPTNTRSPLSRAAYVDESQQTRPPQINFSPLGRRLLKRCLEDSAKTQWPIKRQQLSAGIITATDVAHSPSPVAHSQSWGSGARPSSSHSEDVDMKDGPSDTASVKSASHEVMAKPPLPSTAAHNTLVPGMSPLNNRMSNLHVQLPPNHFAVPSTPGAATPGSLQSPSDTVSQPAQTPGGSITAPSPAKKKMSLGDYMGRRGTMATPTTEKTQAQATTPTLAPPSKPSSQAQSTTPPLSTDGESQSQSQPTQGAETIKNEASPTDTDITMKDVPSKPPISPPYVSSLGAQDDSKVPPTT